MSVGSEHDIYILVVDPPVGLFIIAMLVIIIINIINKITVRLHHHVLHIFHCVLWPSTG